MTVIEQAKQRLDPSSFAVASLMADGRERTLSEISRRSKISESSARRALKSLCDKNLVTFEVIGGALQVKAWRSIVPRPGSRSKWEFKSVRGKAR